MVPQPTDILGEGGKTAAEKNHNPPNILCIRVSPNGDCIPLVENMVLAPQRKISMPVKHKFYIGLNLVLLVFTATIYTGTLT